MLRVRYLLPLLFVAYLGQIFAGFVVSQEVFASLRISITSGSRART